MTIEVKVPMLPESVADAKVLSWHKKPGEFVKRDEPLVDLETDKVVLEVPAPTDGLLLTILKPNDTVVKTNESLAQLQAMATASTSTKIADITTETASEMTAGPAARRAAAEHGVELSQITGGSGPAGRITREDVLSQLADNEPLASSIADERLEKRVPMTRLRARIAERLLAAQHQAAILTTFNEVNLQKVMDLRAAYKDSFEKKYAVRLGLMSFFTKAVVEALKIYPAVNASIDGHDVVYHHYFDIGIAVSSERGLVVPIIRSADRLSFAELEKAISTYGRKAREAQITLEEMTGGTFTISNGGVFGSLLATPIINPPQAAILGMNKIEERPIVEKGQIVIRPMMYLALSYDHRLIDGKESIGFLLAIKEFIEDPSRLLLAV